MKYFTIHKKSWFLITNIIQLYKRNIIFEVCYWKSWFSIGTGLFAYLMYTLDTVNTTYASIELLALLIKWVLSLWIILKMYLAVNLRCYYKQITLKTNVQFSYSQSFHITTTFAYRKCFLYRHKITLYALYGVRMDDYRYLLLHFYTEVDHQMEYYLCNLDTYEV